jgi:hypothetical protein
MADVPGPTDSDPETVPETTGLAERAAHELGGSTAPPLSDRTEKIQKSEEIVPQIPHPAWLNFSETCEK